MTEYVKIAEGVEIQYTEKEGQDDLVPSFLYNGDIYYLDDFIRTHDNPYMGGIDCPDYIHGYDSNNYWNPLFVELVDDSTINIYEGVYR